ncbi:hypothetical protein ACH5RR_015264 [Cinchona calisaya]|uniref:Uncharacterized protein n=1 Tax=Cinchona calisaya TaxID=153742 RepID=A0ABD2ZVR7_9GENT
MKLILRLGRDLLGSASLGGLEGLEEEERFARGTGKGKKEGPEVIKKGELGRGCEGRVARESEGLEWKRIENDGDGASEGIVNW